MKKLFTLLFVFAAFFGFSQSEIQNKAHALALEYQTATSANEIEVQAAESVLINYFTYQSNGGTISAVMQDEVNSILSAIINGAPSALKSANATTASASNFIVNGTLTSADPAYNRIYGANFNSSNLCQTQGNISSNVYYDVYEFSVTEAGHVTIEITSAPFDSYLALYCTFDPMNPQNNVIETNDDGGDGLLSELTDLDLPVGTYYMVVHTFSNGETGDYTVEVNSNDGVVVLGGLLTVSVSYWWMFGLFLVIAMSVVIRKIL